MNGFFPFTSKARKCGNGWVDVCPAHNDRSPSLSISQGEDGRLLLFCHAGCRFEDIVAAAGIGGLRIEDGRDSSNERAIRDHIDRSEAERTKRALEIWREGQPLAGSLSELYLRSRCIHFCSPHQRHHAGLWLEDTNQLQPALITAVQRGGRFVGLHRIYLTASGSKITKKMLGPCSGGAAHLVGDTGPLIVAEGIETALSIPALYTQPARYWAALSAGGMKSLELPQRAGELFIAADGDAAGSKAAEALGTRAARQGWVVKILTAPEGRDWNDVLMERTNAAI